MIEEYEEGSLKGFASVRVLLEPQTLIWLKHASAETGYSIDRLVEISTCEAALRYAQTNKLDSK